MHLFSTKWNYGVDFQTHSKLEGSERIAEYRGIPVRLNKRLNTGMAPTCDWMIKIVKVNKLYFNSLLVSIVYRVSQSGTMKYQCEWKHRCIKQEMVTYVAKGRQPFLFSEVVQRYSGDEKVICWLAPLTKLIKSVEADDQRLEPFLYFTADRNSSDSNVY